MIDREKILKRTLPGRSAAKRMGRLGGRPTKLDDNQIKMLYDAYSMTKEPVSSICKRFNIGRTAFYEYRTRWENRNRNI